MAEILRVSDWIEDNQTQLLAEMQSGGNIRERIKNLKVWSSLPGLKVNYCPSSESFELYHFFSL